MIEIRNARIEFGAGVSAESASRIAGRALELVAARATHRAGAVSRLELPAVELAADPDHGAAAEALAEAICRGISASGREDRHA